MNDDNLITPKPNNKAQKDIREDEKAAGRKTE